ncbi:hypothetical protein QRO11_12945 [Paracidovorax citrulli]|uniref:Uncharacterized protein n=1 Tax=Paracidovorax citrulli TaxID=80869 RepID=A0ABY9AIV0_PARCI|nr:hypothetical protein [Paracidovorax citrulli]MVT28294.1 hypothetical protein [Paracidovorax citrulli]PVY63081.1 hypothetical protein C8E08_0353 [Paracidovorax citrulli]QCX12619.1 hypothetical protein APS58_3907 [Paracidovorax citrulli]REG67936.1 hypothetical protein C8E07_1026 [Paracidovorax citrulli]RLJ92495.1 hypothetical protein C8E06_1027 [Paracidovorax citrulli]
MAILFPAPLPAAGSPGKSDLAQAPEALPDGPNVAPSAHEHEAAQGCLPENAGSGPVRGPEKSAAAGAVRRT